MVALTDANIAEGQLGVKTTSFTLDQANCMEIAVCMDGIPAYVMPCFPNVKYSITAAPEYYIVVTDLEQGTTLPSSVEPRLDFFISSPVRIQFSGKFSVSCVLDEHLDFKFQ
jgi:hypothetical protein